MTSGEFAMWAAGWFIVALVAGTVVVPMTLYACIHACVSAYYGAILTIAKAHPQKTETPEEESITEKFWKK